MSVFKLITTYSFRLIRREKRKFALPFLSLLVTNIVLTLILILTGSSADLLAEQARELQGGDVILESSTMFDGADVLSTAGIVPDEVSEQISFSGTLQSEQKTAPFSVDVVDSTYPLYGEILLEEGIFSGVNPGEIYLDRAGLERLSVSIGDDVIFGEATLNVAGVIVSKPTLLFGGFLFLPTALMSEIDFARSTIDSALLRAEYTYAVKVPTLTPDMITAIKSLEDTYPTIDTDIAGQDQQGLQFGLRTVSDFLTVAVLITAVLSAVNVYASTLYLITLERKSLAVLLALGLRKSQLVMILGTALGYVVTLANIVGIGAGVMLFRAIQNYVSDAFVISLPTPNILLLCAISFSVIAVIAVMSFLPAVRKSLELNPKEILIGGQSLSGSKNSRSIITITLSTLIPLIVVSSFLLNSFVQGVLVIGIIASIYSLVALLYAFVLKKLYQARHKAGFIARSIISQKYVDGLFGIVSFTSLFVALASLSTLAILQVSLERFLVNDLSDTVPSTYVLDVQPSQKDALLENFGEIELFNNVGARIIAIDTVRIQDELDKGSTEISGELRREFNLTSRAELLPSETISAGTWSDGAPGEISVDEDFAEQANIKLGSTLIFSIQGFEISGSVTSLRATDSRSGLPFFYFVLSPQDLEAFPRVYFGFADYDTEKQQELGRYLATTMPNVSLIETQSIGPLIRKLVGTLTTLVLIVTIPPLLIATLLITMLVLSSYTTRQREGARLRAIGLSKRKSFWHYLLETISVTVVASLFGYAVGVASAGAISTYFLDLESLVLFDLELLTGIALVVVFVVSIALYLYRKDRVYLRQLLSYE